MKCDKAKIYLMEYIDGELGENLRQEVRAHLESCGACKEYQESLLSVVSPIRSSQKLQVPENIWQEIKSSIASKDASKNQTIFVPDLGGGVFGFLRRRRMAFVPATIAAILFVAVFLYAKVQTRQNELSNYISEQATSISQFMENGEDDLGISTIFDNGLL